MTSWRSGPPCRSSDFAAARRSGATLFSLTYGRNVLAGDPAERAPSTSATCSTACALPASTPSRWSCWRPAARQAERNANLPAVVEWLGEQVLPWPGGNVTIAIENCPAVGNIATSPAMWLNSSTS
ncbi:MAG: hypothetical protein U0X20_03255 [Caldilineaceae bacterium]